MSELRQLQDMMAEIIRIVGNTNSMVESLTTKVDVLADRVDNLTDRVDALEIIVKENHLEVMRELKTLRTDLDYVENKTNQNEREIFRIKKLITG